MHDLPAARQWFDSSKPSSPSLDSNTILNSIRLLPLAHRVAALFEHHSPPPLEIVHGLLRSLAFLLFLAVDADTCSNDAAAYCEDRVDASALIFSAWLAY